MNEQQLQTLVFGLVDKLGGKAEISVERVEELGKSDTELLFGFDEETNSVVLQILTKEEVAELIAKEAQALAEEFEAGKDTEETKGE